MINASHIAITTLLSKVEELERQKKSFEAEKQGLEERIREATSQIRDLYFVIDHLRDGSISPSKNEAPQASRAVPDKELSALTKDDNSHLYPFHGSLRDKLLYALQQKERFLHSREIARFIVDNEPKEDIEKVLELISKQVARYKRNNVIVSVTDNSGRNTFYGLPQWLDEHKKLKTGYEPSFTPTRNRKERGE